jgi:hypothetical protein
VVERGELVATDAWEPGRCVGPECAGHVGDGRLCVVGDQSNKPAEEVLKMLWGSEKKCGLPSVCDTNGWVDGAVVLRADGR